MEKNVRNEVVRRLYNCGITYEKIAKATDISSDTVRKCVNDMGLLPRDAIPVYATSFRLYTMLATKEEKLSEADQIIHDFLHEFLRIDQIRDHLHGTLSTMEQLMSPQFDLEMLPYYKFVCALFGKSRDIDPNMDKKIWGEYLKGAQDHSVINPQSRQACESDLCNICISQYRHRIMPIWDKRIISVIERVLKTLNTREEKVLRMRFGFGEARGMDLEEVAHDFEVTRERIRQIEAKALRRLRHPSRKKVLEVFSVPTQEIFSDVLQKIGQEKLAAELLECVQEAREREEENPQLFDVLLRRVDELELNARTFHCLENHHIEYIFQLVLKTEREVLQFKNFGRKCLREIREVLGGIGLHLGMPMDREVLRRLEDIAGETIGGGK